MTTESTSSEPLRSQGAGVISKGKSYFVDPGMLFHFGDLVQPLQEQQDHSSIRGMLRMKQNGKSSGKSWKAINKFENNYDGET